MNFLELRMKIKDESKKGTFENSSDLIQKIIFDLNKTELIPIITEIAILYIKAIQ